MSNLQVMKPAPSFRVPALKGREFVTISSDELRGKWVVLAFYPLDFTFVCPTELVGLNDKHGEFADREAVVLTASTRIIDVTGPEPKEMKGYVPPRSVVIPGTTQKKFPAGEFGVPCALIIGQRKESTDKKTSLNEALREHNVAV